MTVTNLALAFEGILGRQDLFSEVLRGVGLRRNETAGGDPRAKRHGSHSIQCVRWQVCVNHDVVK